jgi:hypothetical protein
VARARGSLTVALSLCSCARGPIEIDLPPEVATKAAAIVALQVEGEAEPRAVVLIDPRAPRALPALDPYRGETIDLAVVGFDVTGEELGISPGPLEPVPRGTTLSRLSEGAQRFGLRIEEGEVGSWHRDPVLPAAIAEFPVKRGPKATSCEDAVVQQFPFTGERYHEVIDAVVPGDDLAVIGGYVLRGRAFLGTVSRDGAITPRELDADSVNVLALAFDGRSTIFASIHTTTSTEARILELDLTGTERRRRTFEISTGEFPRVTRGIGGQVLVYSRRRVLGLTADSTSSVDLTSQFPARLARLVVIDERRAAAVDLEGGFFVFDGERWMKEGMHGLASDELRGLGGDGFVLAAVTTSDLYLRSEERRVWEREETPFPTIRKLSVTGLGDGELLLSGSAGALGVRRQVDPAWCTVTTGSVRWLVKLIPTADPRVFLSFDDADTDLHQNMIFFWITLPESD